MEKYKIIKIKIMEKGYSSKGLADKLNITEQTISNWINGKNIKQIDKFVELCILLDIDIKDL